MTREEISRKQAASARGYDLQGEEDIGDEVMDMTPEEFLDFVGTHRTTITNPVSVSRRVLQRKLSRLEKERRMLTRCIIKIKILIGN
jgi:hypothetical protein